MYTLFYNIQRIVKTAVVVFISGIIPYRRYEIMIKICLKVFLQKAGPLPKHLRAVMQFQFLS